jgi:hypothetical protein
MAHLGLAGGEETPMKDRLIDCETAQDGGSCKLPAGKAPKARPYKARPGDRAFGPCNREACPKSKGYTWQRATTTEVLHACPIPGKVGQTEMRALKPGPLFGEVEA